MRILFFGTYDARRHPRVAVLREGIEGLGGEIIECNVPLGIDTSTRVKIAARPWLAPVFALRVLLAWLVLWVRCRRVPTPDVVVVGYMGQFDVHLARRFWKRSIVALDYMVSLVETAGDRRVGSPRLQWFLERVDYTALSAADIIVVDTEEHRQALPTEHQGRACVVSVGAPTEWLKVVPVSIPSPPLRVVFFGLYTPLQGAPIIGEAIRALADDRRIEFTMIGSGQDLEETKRVANNPRVAWIDWVDAANLAAVVGAHHVCLGVFGAAPKTARVVPNKVFQGAAAGCAVVTCDTPPQRQAFDGAAEFVRAGDATALAVALRSLADDSQRLERLRRAGRARAESSFAPAAVVEPLWKLFEEMMAP